MKENKKRAEASLQVLEAIIDRAQVGPISPEEGEKLRAVVITAALLQREIASKNASIRHLRELMFGSSTEKTSVVLDKQRKKPSDPDVSLSGEMPTDSPNPNSANQGDQTKKKKRQGHGRNGVAAFTGANRIKVPHATLKHGDECPHGDSGKVYEQQTAYTLLRITGMSPIIADRYECECLRCNVCGEVFKAAAPPEAGEKKYDESVPAMIAMLKYGGGMPFNRLEELQAGWGIPMPAGTQWELVEEAADHAEPAFKELIRQGAQADVVHNDDTTMKILEVNRIPAEEEAAPTKKRPRTGTFTSGIIAQTLTGASEKIQRTIALFFTGWKHAGENLADVLAQREENRSAPIQMCDALSRNAPGDFKRLLANCIPHGRRKFVDVVENFPDECRYVLETLQGVFRNDAIAQEKGYTPEERLRFHQNESGPLMKKLKEWFREQMEEQKVEPNSGLGEAIEYMQDHWPALTLFLSVAGAPLNNNVCERSLKMAIRNRKNAYFFKTMNGARVGDIFMSLIHTARLNRENPFEYLIALQRHATEVKETPAQWMPWNYRETLADFTNAAAQPP